MSKKKGRRGLTPEEAELWNRVKMSATPLRPEAKPTPLPDIFEPKDPPAPQKSLPSFRVGERRSATALPPVTQPKPPDLRMDKKTFDRLKRGKKTPEARVDLHGMTQARAHGVLTTFIQDASARGLRLVLVITGKGKDRDEGGPIPTPRGVLRHNVPRWLQQPPLSLLVLQVTEAHLKHGGSGAYYVYLRRRR